MRGPAEGPGPERTIELPPGGAALDELLARRSPARQEGPGPERTLELPPGELLARRSPGRRPDPQGEPEPTLAVRITRAALAGEERTLQLDAQAASGAEERTLMLVRPDGGSEDEAPTQPRLAVLPGEAIVESLSGQLTAKMLVGGGPARRDRPAAPPDPPGRRAAVVALVSVAALLLAGVAWLSLRGP
jgi:hypothetical protein